MRAWFRCASGCPGESPLFEVHYRCPRCGGLLEVAHDLERLRATSAADWRARFRERLLGPSGVWAFKEWVLPEVADERIVSLGEGKAPLIPVPRLARELGLSSLEVKHCGTSHTGSFKDLGMTVLVSAVAEMRARGVPIRAIACASTGDTSAALAAYGAAADVPTIVLLPAGKISPAQLIQPIASGAKVLALDTDFDGCMRIVRALTDDPSRGIYLANSLNALRIEGQKTVALELAFERPSLPDFVVIPGGNLGNVSALGAGFQLLAALGLTEKRPRIAVAQAAAANPLARAYRTGFAEVRAVEAGPTQASAIRIGDPVSMSRAIRTLRAFDGVVEDAEEPEIAEMAARADRHGLFTCPHTAVALVALEKLRRAGTIPTGASVVVISTAHGLKFTGFKEAHHFGPGERRYKNEVQVIPATLDAVLASLERPFFGSAATELPGPPAS